MPKLDCLYSNTPVGSIKIIVAQADELISMSQINTWGKQIKLH